MSRPPLRIAVCGTAHWAETVHIPALQAAPDIDLVAVYGRNADRVAALADKFGIAGLTDFDETLAQVDALSFALPPNIQPALAIKAISAGKHVILEKPIATTQEEALAICSALVASPVAAVCFLTRRYIPEVAAFIAETDAEKTEFGASSFRSGGMAPGSPYANSVWRQAEGATLWDVGPHVLTPLLDVLGPIAQVQLQRDEGGTLTARLTHSNHATSRFEISQNGEAGSLLETYAFDAGDGERRLQGKPYDRVAAFGRAAAELLAGAEEPRPTRLRFAAAAHIVEVLTAASASLQNGEPVKVERNLYDNILASAAS
ncbi:Gfo/Idh/MocA family oxidoreductase [Aureimonas fodinaquatilis]|uniref:Gfo/Idh/MocA family oxidoreductase n=1 Tax=Aureimonas fodinaquatilis TaxID=2565783 RepID=A0A5B0DVX8_9HYPH|nr:Gfo/Idh/MocA family oxidoreductase [Aureimonas fodinaquatilis]KAA0970172.1 Gfo/Idh/MocA family oxidoreductase [Aureimonas fodinaquatilis]